MFLVYCSEKLSLIKYAKSKKKKLKLVGKEIFSIRSSCIQIYIYIYILIYIFISLNNILKTS